MYEAYREHPGTLRLVFHHPFHPVIVIRLLFDYDNNFTFLEWQLVFVVGRAVVQRLASSQTCHAVWRVRQTARWYRAGGTNGRDGTRRYSLRRRIGRLEKVNSIITAHENCQPRVFVHFWQCRVSHQFDKRQTTVRWLNRKIYAKFILYLPPQFFEKA